MMGHRIYLASSWRNRYQPQLVETLRQRDHEVYDFRHPVPGNEGFRWSQIDPGWESWKVFQYRQALNHPLAVQGYRYDVEALIAAEVVVLLLPSGRSAHTEAAWHRGRGGVVIVHSPEPCEPELMYKLFNWITAEDAELVQLLDLDLKQLQNLRLD
ncbi:MAG: hypothetical protein ACE5Q6_03570 [Dehalococcoidia bacterium]